MYLGTTKMFSHKFYFMYLPNFFHAEFFYFMMYRLTELCSELLFQIQC